MTDPELQKLAELWQQPDAGTEEDFGKLIRKARRQAKLMAWIDILLAVAIIGGLAFGALVQPSLASIAGTLLMVASVFWLNWKRRKLRQMVRTLHTEDRDSFFESSLKIARAELARATLSAFIFPPLVLIAILIQVGIKHGGSENLLGAMGSWAVSIRGVISLSLLALLFMFLLRRRRREKDRLRHLEEIRHGSALEAEQDEEDVRKTEEFSTSNT